jgi:hypothetical protein
VLTPLVLCFLCDYVISGAPVIVALKKNSTQVKCVEFSLGKKY